MTGTKAAWTPERRARQSEIIQCTKPWRHSTGPRTKEGKVKVSRNALMFQGDPKVRSTYDAIQLLLKNPPSSMARMLWEQVEAASCDEQKMDADLGIGLWSDQFTVDVQRSEQICSGDDDWSCCDDCDHGWDDDQV